MKGAVTVVRARRRTPRGWLVGGLVLGLALAAAQCAPKTAPPVVSGPPRFPEYIYPVVPGTLGDQALKARHDAAWRALQGGDLRWASREYATVLQKAPGFFPAETGLAYTLLAEAKHRDAVARFDRVLQREPRYAPALAGRGDALAASGQPELAIASYEAARAADPALADLGRRIDVLRFGRLNDLVSAATRATAAGRYDDARRAYEAAITGSPESAFLYRDLGLVELEAGLGDAALPHLTKAVALDPDDVEAWRGLAGLHEQQGRFDEAVAALERVATLEPGEAAAAALTRLRERAALARLPVEYQAIATAGQVTRGDLAALIGVRIQPLLPAPRRASAVVVTDARGHWAATWILGVTRAGLMETFANHTFQPRAAVRRGDLAQVASRVLAVLQPTEAKRTRPPITDVAPDHLSYPAIAAVVAAGVMPLDAGGLFRASRPVTGAEALDLIGRLEQLARKRRPGQPR